MKKLTFSLLIASMAFSVLVTGCKKDEDPDGENPTNQTGDPTQTYNFTDAFGVLSAINSISYTNVGGTLIPVELGTAVAVFPSAAGAQAFLDAGTVQINGKSLTKQTNNSYVYQDFTNPLMLNQVKWDVSGNGNVPAISKQVAKPIPTYSNFGSLPASVTKANGLEVSIAGHVNNADSVLVVVAAGSKWVARTVAGNAAKVTFSAADLSSLPSSTEGMVQVSPRNMTTETISSKKFYFINQATYTKMPVPVN
jgi:hypothetical protein